MPIYQAILIARAGPAQNTVVAIKTIIENMLEKYPHMKFRDVQNLGDRIMGKTLKKNETRHQIGRYIQIIYDGPPHAHYDLVKSCRQPYSINEIIRGYSHKISDEECFRELFFKAGRVSDMHVTDESFKDYEFAARMQKIKESLDKIPRQPKKLF
ncbi:unnamed protein product [Blepharisma stoltei]|uniref:Uncharacterized protein n=1 Tax=Blepharisma stoltei TaxID=1481888 RepID=A0AAU9K6U9_9CILI|nr:unnamed protein product [Blepharisma stoltei]